MNDKSSTSALDTFISQAKCLASPESAVDLVVRVIESPLVHSFSELLDIPAIKSLENHAQHGQYYELLKLFAFGTYKDYLAKQSAYPTPLSANAIMKLRHLSIVSLASKNRIIPYRTLCDNLGIDNVRELEDLIIEAFYADVIKGKLDQMNNQLEIDFVIGRDVTDQNIDEILGVLDDWCKNCEIALKTIETEIKNANMHKQKQLEAQSKIENEVSNLKKTIKIQNQEVESLNISKDNMGSKKSSKLKSMRIGLGSKTK